MKKNAARRHRWGNTQYCRADFLKPTACLNGCGWSSR